MKKLLIFLLLIFSLVGSGAELKLYVSPDGDDSAAGTAEEPKKSIRAAVDEIVKQRTGGNQESAEIIVRKGRYHLSGALVLRPEDTQGGALTFTGEDGAILDGGTPVANWKIAKLKGRSVWRAEAREIGTFRQLFVGGRRATLSRWPKAGFREVEPSKSSESFAVPQGGFPGKGAGLEDMEIVIPHYWISERRRLKSYDVATRTLSFARQTTRPLDDCGTKWGYYLENVLETLSEPGEWAYESSTGYLYYMPCKGESIGKTETCVSRLKHILELAGEPQAGRHIENLTFRNLGFEHSDCVEGAVDSEQSEHMIPAAVICTGAKNVRFEGCSFNQIGARALDLLGGCESCVVDRCSFTDIGGGAIKAIGNGGNTYTNNTIKGCGRVFEAAAGILLQHSNANTVANNEISDLYHNGISVGWSWGFGDSASRDNKILNNHIFNIGQGVLSDLGGIYTLGVQPGTVIEGNYIHDVRAKYYGGWGIYLDQGSAFITVRNNVSGPRLSHAAFMQHITWDVLVENNVFIGGTDCVIQNQHEGEHEKLTEEFMKRYNVKTRKTATYRSNILVPAPRRPTYRTVWPKNGVSEMDSNSNYIVSAKNEVFSTDIDKADERKNWKDWLTSGNDSKTLIGKLTLDKNQMPAKGSAASKCGFNPFSPLK